MGRKTFGALVSAGSLVLVGAPIIAGKLLSWDTRTSTLRWTRALGRRS
ncbi:MAG: hypothetical protein M3Y91_03395 [Actinomycetota bacterium]|nr:hypothetical protein [Actinomycetota bacterium]